MLRDLRERFEFRACVLAFIIVRFAGIYWLLVLAGKFFTREPLLYLYSAESYTQETVPVVATSAVLLLALGYQLLTRTAFGRAADSLILLLLSPKIAVASSIVFLMWASSKPAPRASHAPLATLMVLSIVGSIVVRWGPMSRDSRRGLVAVAAPGDVPADHAPVARVSKSNRTFATFTATARSRRGCFSPAGPSWKFAGKPAHRLPGMESCSMASRETARPSSRRRSQVSCGCLC